MPTALQNLPLRSELLAASSSARTLNAGSPAFMQMLQQEKQTDSSTSPLAVVADTLNPLQHIPIIGGLYRSVSGDNLSSAGMVLGGLLFGGPVGFLAGTAAAVFSAVTQPDTIDQTAGVATATLTTQATKAYAKAGSIAI